MVRTVREHSKGEVKEMGIPVVPCATPGRIKGPSPQPAQHTAETLIGLGYSPEEIEQLVGEGSIKLAPNEEAKR
jgi:crotonobetainyl-CoA:carnitine CoA-transferase CaiB-like acyl-CoA transferase